MEAVAKSQKANDQVSPIGVYQEGMPWNAVEKVIMERRSIRRFKKEPVPDSMIRRILEAGRFAPSAGNTQPWRFVVVNDPEIIKAMEKDAVMMVKLFAFFLDYTRGGWLRRLLTLPIAKIVVRFLPNEIGPVPLGTISQMSQGKTPVFHDAPTLILLIEDKRGSGSPATDIGICGQNMVLAAHSLGAGTCWIGFIQVLMYLPKWRKKFGIKFPYRLNDCIAVGWQKPKADAVVPREAQMVEWYERGLKAPRIERQGE